MAESAPKKMKTNDDVEDDEDNKPSAVSKYYDTLAETINIEDIVSDEVNRDILRKLKNNDPNFDELQIVYERTDVPDDNGGCGGIQFELEYDYSNILANLAAGERPKQKDLGWLGYFIGRNTKLREIAFYDLITTLQRNEQQQVHSRSMFTR